MMAAIAVSLLGVVGCGDEPAAEFGGERAPMIDEDAGSYDGLRLGDTVADVEEAFGAAAPLGEEDAFVPRRVEPWDHRGPVAIRASQVGEAELTAYSYEDVFIMLEDGHVTVIDTVAPGATTVRGVAVGDPIEKAEAAYPELECGTIDESWSACQGRLGSRYIWFGGDPIRDITIGSVRLEGL
jgi:hypothetical protein